MFGKPHWFKPKTFGWGLTPITWQGWIYTLIWTAVLVVPFILLQSRFQFVEAFIWLTASIVALTLDVWHIRKKMGIEKQGP